MRALALLRRHAVLVIAFVLIELVFAWGIAHGVVRSIVRDLGPRPDGANVLFASGSRGVFDLVAHASVHSIAIPVLLVIVAVALWALAGFVIDILASTAFARGRASLRPFPSVLAIEFAASLAYAALAIIGWLGTRAVFDATRMWANTRTADLITIASLLPTATIAFVVHVFRDVAMVRACADPDALDAMRVAWRDVVHSPGHTLGVRFVVLIASAVLLATGFMLSGDAARVSGPLLFAWIAGQQFCAGSRILLRFQWLAHVAATRAIAPAPARDP